MSKKSGIYICIDCGKKIKGYGYRCYSCAIRQSDILRFRNCPENHPSYIDGRSFKHNKCIECGKPIKNANTKCRQCENKRRKNIQFNYSQLKCLTELGWSQNKIAKKFKVNQTVVFYWLKKWKIASRPWKAKPIRHCLDCGVLLNKNTSRKGGLRCMPCSRKQFKGSRNYFFGKRLKPSWIKYNSKMFRSGWEANFAKWLDLSGIQWEYEPKTFDLGSVTYTPDFYLPELDCYIEIKGYWQEKAKRKFKFVQKYFDIDLDVFDEKILKRLGIIN